MRIQIAKDIFLNSLATMKEVLSLAEFKLGRDTEDYRYFKRQTMNAHYNGLIRIFQKLEHEKLIIRCECMARLRQGYSTCEFCGGSGYRNNEPKPALINTVPPTEKDKEVVVGQNSSSTG